MQGMETAARPLHPSFILFFIIVISILALIMLGVFVIFALHILVNADRDGLTGPPAAARARIDYSERAQGAVSRRGLPCGGAGSPVG